MDVQKKKMRPTTSTCTVISNEEQEEIGEDRISSLQDELIHYILWFSNVRSVVQTSVLSKRWKLIWTTLPFLSFTSHNIYHESHCYRNSFSSSTAEIMFFENFLSNRNHHSDILKLYLSFVNGRPPPRSLFEKFLSYAIAHNVQQLTVVDVPNAIKLSCFSSTTAKKLSLHCDELLDFTDCWYLPALTTLDLFRLPFSKIVFPGLYLICLPCLQTLLLDGFELPESISLPSLTTLYLTRCNLPPKVWDCPALLTLTLKDIVFPEYTTDFFPALVNLRNLTLLFEVKIITDCFVNCSQLVNLKIEAWVRTIHHGKILVLAPKLRTFTSVGLFRITFGVSELEYVNIKLPDNLVWMNFAPSEGTKKYYRQGIKMFRGLGSARILSLDLQTIEVPQGYKESSMSTRLKCYLFGLSPKATIVTTSLQKNMIRHAEAAFVTAQNVILQQPLPSSTMLLVGSKDMHKEECVETLDMGLQKEHVMQDSVVDADRVSDAEICSKCGIGVPVVGTGNDWVCSSKGVSNFGLWQGHEVNSDFVCLLDLIINKYPETFEHFSTINKKFCTMKLNMLCTSVNDFTKIPMTLVDAETIAEYKAVFADLQKLGFDVSWLVNRLNFIKQLRFSLPLCPEFYAIDCQIDDTKTKLQVLHNLRTKKMQEIHKAFGTMGTNVVVGCVGDGLLCGH